MPSSKNNLINKKDIEFWKKQAEVLRTSGQKRAEPKQKQTKTQNKAEAEKKHLKNSLKTKEKPNLPNSLLQLPVKQEPLLKPAASTPAQKEQKKKYEVLPAMGSAVFLCLCLAFFPLVKNLRENHSTASHPIEEHPSLRGLASEKERKEKTQKLLKKYTQQSRQSIENLKKGRRTLASIGQTPHIKDNFYHGLLQSRYHVKWRRNRLKHLSVLKDQEPLPVSALHIFQNYKSFFSEYENITERSNNTAAIDSYKDHRFKIMKAEEELQKQGFSPDQVQTYTLQRKGRTANTVIVFTDSAGRLLYLRVF